MSPKIHSTDERTEDIDLLNSSISGVRTAFLNGACKRTRRGYAGSPYIHMGSPRGEKAFCSKTSNRPDSFNIDGSCFFPSTKNQT